MILTILIIIAVVGTLSFIAQSRGLQSALPFAACFLVIFPEEMKVPIPGAFDFTTQRIIVITLALLCFLDAKASRRISSKLPLSRLLVCFIIWWTASVLGSVAFSTSMKALVSQIIEYFLVYYLFATYVDSVSTLKKIFFGLGCGMVVCSFFGLLEAYGHWTVISLFPVMYHRFGASGGVYVEEARGLRIQSTFGHPILFGSALAMTIPMAVYLVSTSRAIAKKLLLWVGILMMTACIYQTGSRGPWIALVGSLGLLLVLGRGALRKIIVVIALLAAATLVIRPGVAETILNNYLATVDKHSYQAESYLYRYVLYQLVIDKLNGSLFRSLWGYGPESYPFLHLQGAINGRTMTFVSCDSSFAALLVETGYIGFMIAVTLLATVLSSIYKTYMKILPSQRAICLIFLANFATFTFMMTNVAIFRWGQQATMFWIVVALTMIYPGLIDRERSPEVVEAETPSTELPVLSPWFVHSI